MLQELSGSLDTFRRWGITQGQGALVGATLGRATGAAGGRGDDSGEIDPAQAAKQADEAVTELQNSLR